MKKQKYVRPTVQQTTVFLTVALFVLMLASVIVSVLIPWMGIIQSPGVNRTNSILIMISLAGGALAPLIIGYSVGCFASRSKKTLDRAFNGALFTVLAYWLTSAIAFVLYTLWHGVTPVYVNVIPIVLMLIGVVALGICYRRTTKSGSALRYPPYVLLLGISFILAVVVAPIVSQLQSSTPFSVGSILSVAFGLIAVGLAYILLRRRIRTKHIRISLAIMSYSFALIAMLGLGQLLPYTAVDSTSNIVMSVVAGVVGLLVFAGFIWLIPKESSLKGRI